MKVAVPYVLQAKPWPSQPTLPVYLSNLEYSRFAKICWEIATYLKHVSLAFTALSARRKYLICQFPLLGHSCIFHMISRERHQEFCTYFQLIYVISQGERNIESPYSMSDKSTHCETRISGLKFKLSMHTFLNSLSLHFLIHKNEDDYNTDLIRLL